MRAFPTGSGYHGVPIPDNAFFVSGLAIGRLPRGNHPLREAAVVRATHGGVSASAPAEGAHTLNVLYK